MSVSTSGLVLIALACGTAGALTAVAVQSLDESPAASSEGPLLTEVAGLRAQLTRMESRQGEQDERLSRLELAALSAPADSGPTPILASPEMVADLQQQVARLAEERGDIDVSGLDLEQLDAALTVLREREEAERDEQRQAMREQRLEERLAELAEALGLNSYQVDQMRTVANDGAEQRDALMDEIRESGDFGSMRERFETLGADLTARMETFLTADQMAGFEDNGGLRSLSGRGPGGFGGGGFGGGGGRRGRGGDN